MATMHPMDIENYNYTSSEKELYNALKEQLPEKFQVFYSVRWFETVDDKRIDSESDFIVFDPSFGFLTIEVKGGTGIEINNGVWTLIENYGSQPASIRQMKCSPYEQAEKSMRHFFNYFYQEFNQTFNGVFGFAAAFPRYAISEQLSTDAPPEITIDASDMKQIQTKINKIFHYWKNKKNINAPFSSEQRNRFISAINKRISLSAAAGALIPMKSKELSKISFVQDSILDTLYNYNQVQIVGGAGTGKTFIGIKKAIREAYYQKKVLFTCCSIELSNYVSKQLHTDLDITCLTYDDLMASLLGESYATISKDINGDSCCFDLINSLNNSIEKYDSIIVDEAQDFDVDMGLSIRALLKDDKASILYVLFDKNQNIFDQNFENAFAIEYPPFVLRYNIRNTGCIYKYATELTNLGKDTFASSLIGVEPECTKYKNSTQAKKSLTNIVNRLVYKEYVMTSSIVVLSDLPFEQSILSGETHIGALKISFHDLDEICANEICFKTSPQFKGLESDIVIFLTHSIEGIPDSKLTACNKYVAITRARYYLYILNTTTKLVIGG